MGRDEMLAMLLGMLAAKGRQEALLGSDLTPAREAFARMAPQKSEVHAYFETPLSGERGLDVHCIVSKSAAFNAAPSNADPVWQDVVRWLYDVQSQNSDLNSVSVMAEADTSRNASARPGIGLIQRSATQLVEPFLALAGEAPKASAWDRFARNLPQGWKTSYVGIFLGRPQGLLRVNAHPARRDALPLGQALEAFGYDVDERSLEVLQRLAEMPRSFDLQLDLDEQGQARGVLGLELYVEGGDKTSLLSDDGRGARIMALLQELGIADERWKTLADADMSRRVPVPVDGRLESCSLSLRKYSLKVKYADGEIGHAKAYLRGDAMLDEGEWEL